MSQLKALGRVLTYRIRELDQLINDSEVHREWLHLWGLRTGIVRMYEALIGPLDPATKKKPG